MALARGEGRARHRRQPRAGPGDGARPSPGQALTSRSPAARSRRARSWPTRYGRSTGQRASPTAAHIGRWADVDDLAEAVYREHGRVDVLVNNAGMSPLYPSLVDVSEELFDKVIGVNLKGPFRLAALVGRAHGGARRRVDHQREQCRRHTANARTSCRTPPPRPASTRSTVGFAQAYGPTVRVNSIMCGPFFTDISKAWDMKAFGDVLESYPLGRGGQPHEVVGAALYLASDASSFTTGTRAARRWRPGRCPLTATDVGCR